MALIKRQGMEGSFSDLKKRLSLFSNSATLLKSWFSHIKRNVENITNKKVKNCHCLTSEGKILQNIYPKKNRPFSFFFFLILQR